MSVPDAVNANATDESSLTARQAALAGVAAGAAGLGVAELLAGLLPGAASPIIAVGDLVISLQPPGAKQIVVDLFGTADKLVLNLFIAIVALGLAALVGIVARRRPQAGLVGFGAFGVVILAAALSGVWGHGGGRGGLGGGAGGGRSRLAWGQIVRRARSPTPWCPRLRRRQRPPSTWRASARW